MNGQTGKAALNPWFLLVALGPAVIFTISQSLMEYAAEPFDILPERIADFEMYKAAAANTTMLGALMLFVGAALGALCFFVYTLKMLDWLSRALTLGGFGVLAIMAVLSGNDSHDAHDYVGRTLSCISAGYGDLQPDAPAITQPTQPAQPPAAPAPATKAAGVLAEPLRGMAPCDGAAALRLMNLGNVQFNLIALAFSALMFGAICCLAVPSSLAGRERPATPPGPAEPGAAADPALRYWERQSQWLNTYLYLSALLLGTALLFINAYLQFPGHVLLDRTTFDANVAASVSYYGFVFTVMLAAFYVPVAITLATRVSALKPAASGDSKLPDAFRGPLQILKIVLGLCSTALVGILPNLLGLIG